MGISDAFSGRSGRRAAQWGIQQAQANQVGIDARIDAGRTGALGALDAGEAGALATLDNVQPQTLSALGDGFTDARTAYGQARDLYHPYAEVGRRGFAAFADSTGANGPEGYDRSAGSFRASPGYQYRVDEATDGVARKASALGALGSGNTMTAIQDRAANLADQEYSGWQGNLQQLGQTGLAATGAQAGLQRGLGELRSTEGTASAGILDANAGRRTGLITGAATGRAGAWTGAANAGAQSLQNTGNSILQLGRQGLMAGQEASNNTWNALLGGANTLATLGARMYGGR